MNNSTKNLIKNLILGGIVVAGITSFSYAHAQGIGSVKDAYTNEAVYILENNGYDTSSMYVSCAVSGDGEQAVCNAIYGIYNGYMSIRASHSLFCHRDYANDAEELFLGMTCDIRPLLED